MNMAVYVDTGALIALFEPSDGNHEAAKRVIQNLFKDEEPLITGWHTLVEFLDGLVHHYDQARAASEMARLHASPRLSILPSDHLKEEAMDTLQNRTDWNVDASDCLSFALMDEKGVEKAFGFDSDFRKPGFRLIPGGG